MAIVSNHWVLMPPYTVDQVCKAYGFPDSQGEGECIGIISFDGGYHQAQVDAFCGRSVEITEVPVDGAQNNPKWFETTQDIAIAASVAPRARIAVYLARPSKHPEALLDVVQDAIRDSKNNPSVLCICYVYDERIWGNYRGSNVRKEVEREFESAKEKGITICAATGDLARGALYPASSPWVLACGGSQLTLNESGAVAREHAWRDAGYGVSALFEMPEWQSKARGVVPGGRNVPDVSGYAWPGYEGRSGDHYALFGTSAVAPLFSGLIARWNSLHNTRVGFLNDRLYTGKLPRGMRRTFSERSGLGSRALRALLTSNSGAGPKLP
jgi:kumamolisin